MRDYNHRIQSRNRKQRRDRTACVGLSTMMVAAATLVAIVAVAIPLFSCGRDFPNRFLLDDGYRLVTVPRWSFALHRVERIGPVQFPAVISKKSPQEQSREAALRDFTRAVEKSVPSAVRRRQLVVEYSRLRAQMTNAETVDAMSDDLINRAGFETEFRRYLLGALAFRQGRQEAARARWRSVLDLPPVARRYRSIWAAFMIGTSWLKEKKPAEAIRWFRKVRRLRTAGFSDTLGLAAASLGWEARAELDAENLVAALDLYLDHYDSGDRRAATSIKMVLRRVFKSPTEDSLRSLARVPRFRSLVSAYVGSRAGSGRTARTKGHDWLKAVEHAAVDDFREAIALAWASYDAGDVDAAERWLRTALEDAPAATWLRAKLSLYHGEVDTAVALLRRVSRRFPRSELWHSLDPRDRAFPTWTPPLERALEELGVLLLARRQYVETLDTFLQAGNWLDAAYVAERVLALEELERYVARAWPAPLPVNAVAKSAGGRSLGADLRYILARRLARASRYDDAGKLAPADVTRVLAEYVSVVKAGRDVSRSAPERAASLWRAARLRRYKGMELFGTEMEPDWSVYEGGIRRRSYTEGRPKIDSHDWLVASDDEMARAHAPQTDLRFHYRYDAADLAWEAAELYRGSFEALARLLCEAGTWIKQQNPKKADRFYKALVLRCPDTDLGKEADRLRWFPRIECRFDG